MDILCYRVTRVVLVATKIILVAAPANDTDSPHAAAFTRVWQSRCQD